VALVVPTACGLADNAAETRASLASEIGRRLATAAQEEQVRDFVIVDRLFSIDRGELTPKLSLCREAIARNFAAELEAGGLSSK